jgi:hypothetical protein
VPAEDGKRSAEQPDAMTVVYTDHNDDSLYKDTRGCAVALVRSVWLISVIAVAVFGCSAAVATGYWQPAAIGVGFGGAQAGLAIVAGWRIRQVRESLPDPVAPAVLAFALRYL